MKNYLSSFYHGRGDWTTNRKIVVFESDDWGNIRMPSKKTYNHLLNKGYPVDENPFDRYDSIASNEDFEHLVSTLEKFKDKKGRTPVFTANVITGNPDFKKISNHQFSKYFVEDFTDTIERYHRSSIETWLNLINSGILFPQYHGREHLNVFTWLRALREGGNFEKEAFRLGFIGIPFKKDTLLLNQHQIAFNCDTDRDEISNFLKNSLKDGGIRFNNAFGFKSKSFIAPAYTWNNFIERKLLESGVTILQGGRYQSLPLSSKKIRHTIGEKKDRITYLVRNAYFEPSTIIDVNQRGRILEQLKQRTNALFDQNKPVIISSHRLNYIGVLDESNRIVNLNLLKRYLQYILEKHPDIEFLTTLELAELISNENS